MFDPMKYQPQSISDIVFGNPDSSSQITDLTTGRYGFPPDRALTILLYGGYGTGKTTLARLLPAGIELSHTGHELAFEADFVSCQQGYSGPQMLARIENTLRSSSPNASGRWYFVVDEIDNLSESAQRSLKSLLNSRFAAFVLTTNYASELDRGLLDRCTAIEMNKAPNEMFLATARRMADDMDFTVSDDDLLQLIERCNGSFRRLPDVIRMAARRAAA